METRKYRLLVAPLDNAIASPLFHYYEARECCGPLVASEIVFFSDYGVNECYSRLHVWDEAQSEWVAYEGGEEIERSEEPATWDEARALMPEFSSGWPQERDLAYLDEDEF